MKISDKPTHIYILYDPTFQSKRFYVGKTEQKPKRRLSGHLKKSNLEKNYYLANWLKSLLAKNIMPAMHILFTVASGQDWEMMEKTTISFFQWCEIDLVNGTSGGESGKPAGWKYTEEAKAKMSIGKKGKSTWNKGLVGSCSGNKNAFYGKTHSIETKEIMRQKALGRKHSPEARIKMKTSNKPPGGWNKGTNATTKFLPITRGEENPASKITKEEVIKIRELYSTGNYTFVDLAKQFSISNVSIANIVRHKTWKHI